MRNILFQVGLLFLGLLLASVEPAVAAQRHVGTGQAYSTIQAAIDAAAGGDEIIVHPGTYPEMIRFHGKDIDVHSTDPTDPSVIDSTIIDGENTRICVYFDGNEPATSRLAGFTITRGRSVQGAGIYGQGADTTIEHNNITNNYISHIGESRYGKGAGIWDCDGLIANNLIADNKTANINYGAGGGLAACDGTIRGNRIVRNAVLGAQSQGGGGLYHCTGLIERNLIADNVSTVTLGKGAGLYYCAGTIRNNLIVNNTANYHAGLADCDGPIFGNTIYGNTALMGSGGGLGFCDGAIRNNIIWGNHASTDPQVHYCSDLTYNTVEGGFAGTGNLAGDPRLTDPGSGDFQLLADSPCIDAGCAGDLTEDYEGNPRPQDGTVFARGDGSEIDMGALEFVPKKNGGIPAWRCYR